MPLYVYTYEVEWTLCCVFFKIGVQRGELKYNLWFFYFKYALSHENNVLFYTFPSDYSLENRL